MKYLISLMFSGLLFSSTLFAQNTANNGPRILDQVDVVTNTAEDNVTNISSRELFVMENSMNDYSSTIWSREIYRQIADDEGNETFFYPVESTESRVNLFSLIVNLLSTNTIHAYKYEAQPDMSESKKLDGRAALEEAVIPFTAGDNNTVIVKKEDIPSVRSYIIWLRKDGTLISRLSKAMCV